METIKFEQLADWLIDTITERIHKLRVKEEWISKEDFNNWAKSFQREEAAVLVNMEFVVDWGEEERKEIPIEEASSYANKLMQTILDIWYL